jgi:hypothetical protein
VRVALISGAVAVVMVVSTTTAGAVPVGRQFAPVGGAVAWNATNQGTPENSTVTVDVAEVATGDELPDGDNLSPGQHYFYVALHANYEFAGVLAPVTMPVLGATLTTPGGSVTGQSAPTNLGVDAQWYFPVPADLNSATLAVDGFTKVLGNEDGDFTPWTFSPVSIGFVATSPVPTTPTTSVPAPSSVPATKGQHHATEGKQKVASRSTSSGTPAAATLGTGAAGLLALAGGAAGLVSLRRRRAFYRADRDGRMTFSGAPSLVGGATLATGAVLSPDRRAILVKLLGPLVVQGTKRPVRSGPVLEIVLFLALNPGESFTSIQLRERIWGLGRQPIKSQTFRSYVMQLRKAMGSGVIEVEAFHYQLTGVVTTDYDQFGAALLAEDTLAGAEQALALVRGPVMHGAFDGKKNSPFAWAVDKANDIEDEVTSTAVELAVSCLELQDPRRAAAAVSQGLLSSEANLRLRKLDLGVGAALGGANEVGRRLAAGRAVMATFPKDVAGLEELASQLGWEAHVPG